MTEKAQIRGMERLKEMREAGELVFKTPAQKLVENPTALRAIRLFCFECSGFNANLAKTCDNKKCALYLFRKGRTTFDEADKSSWAKEYEKWMRYCEEFENNKEGDNEDDIED